MCSLKGTNKTLVYTQSVIKKEKSTTNLKLLISKPFSDYNPSLLLLFVRVFWFLCLRFFCFSLAFLTYEHILFCFACFLSFIYVILLWNLLFLINIMSRDLSTLIPVVYSFSLLCCINTIVVYFMNISQLVCSFSCQWTFSLCLAFFYLECLCCSEYSYT